MDWIITLFVLVCDFAVLCKLWWRSAAAWRLLCEWAGFGYSAKQPLWEDFQTRNTQEVQYAGMQDPYRFVCNVQSVSMFVWLSGRFEKQIHYQHRHALSMTLQNVFVFLLWVCWLKSLWINVTLNIIALHCFMALDNWVVFILTQAQFARRTPLLLASVTSWSCWVAAPSGRSIDNVVSPVGHSQGYTPTNITVDTSLLQ